MSEDKKNFAERYMAFRKDVSEMNWDDDGTNASQGYGFLSESKIKSQLSPALVKHDLGFKVDYDDLRILEPVGSMKQHYIIRVTVVIFDPSKGPRENIIPNEFEKVSFQAYGEGANSGDKAISVTQTNALKNALANNLLLATTSVDSESKMEAKASDSVNQDTSIQGIKKEAKETLVQTNPPQQTVQTSVPKGINAVQSSAMEKIMSKIRTKTEPELTEFGGLTEIESELATVKASNDSKQAAMFIQKYKVIV